MTTHMLERKHKARSRSRLHIPGSAPGSLIVDPRAPRPVIHVLAYGPGELHEQEIKSPRNLAELMHRWPVLWVNVSGLGDAGTIEKIGQIFSFHLLTLEDVLNVQQRPKVEEYDNYLFLVARMMSLSGSLESEQISLFLAKDFVVTFQERHGDCFDPVRERIRKGQERIRQHASDYLAYALLDAVVDSYFPVLEEYGERLESLEDEVVSATNSKTIADIHQAKRDLLTLRRALWPLREAVNSLMREKTSLFSEETHVYLRDCYDHSVQIIDMLETYRETASGLLDVYLSSLSNRMNGIMKVLTMIATIFMPLSFIAGVYGMNFNPAKSPWNMPELEWYWGYPYALGLMFLVVAGMLIFFRRKGWLS
jgi:magnesium transporter